ncbi:hypothetical protein D3C83_12060 [compost metagenome]
MTRQIRQRVDFVPAAETERRPSCQEEGHVGAEGRRDVGQLRRAQRQLPQAREPGERRRRIAAAAAQSRLDGNPLVQANDDVRERRLAPARLPERFSGAPHEVPAVERHARRVALDGERPLARLALDHVVQRDRLEDGAQLVKAVGPHAEDAQVQVDLGVGADGDAQRRVRARLRDSVRSVFRWSVQGALVC